jgi:hypothetical protein
LPGPPTRTPGLIARVASQIPGAEEVLTQLDAWAELPATELAALKALRHQVVDMQQLLAPSRGRRARGRRDPFTGLRTVGESPLG